MPRLLLKIILAETTTLGVRQQTIERVSVPRSIETVDTPLWPDPREGGALGSTSNGPCQNMMIVGARQKNITCR